MSDATLTRRLAEAMKSALRTGDKRRLGVIRLILAEVRNVEVDERIVVDDGRVLAILDKMTKQRRDSLQQFSAAGREDLAAQEQFELDAIADFLPVAFSEAELAVLVEEAVAATGAGSIRDMGRVMAILKPQVLGRADMTTVGQRVRARLA